MTEDIQLILEMCQDGMKKAMNHLADELSKIRAGRANPSMLDGIFVDYYGANTPLNQVANVNSPDARTLTVQPWEKTMIEPIEKAIIIANLGLNPQNNGNSIIINVPVLTEERRKALVKQVKAAGEDAKISLRNARKEANDEIKRLEKDGLSEDLCKDAEAEVQKITNVYTTKVDTAIEAKEVDIMKV